MSSGFVGQFYTVECLAGSRHMDSKRERQRDRQANGQMQNMKQTDILILLPQESLYIKFDNFYKLWRKQFPAEPHELGSI